MDYVTRQFINLTKQLRKELRKSLSRLNGALDKQTEAISKAYKASNDQKSPPPEITVLTNLPESITVHQNTKDARDERNYKRAMFFVTSLTLGAIVIYADLVYWQYREMISVRHQTQQAIQAANRSASAAEKANTAVFEADRPWIGEVFANEADTGFTEIPHTNKYHYSYVWHFRNAGKRPAIITQIHTTGGWYKECTMLPRYDYKTPPSRSLMIPGFEILSRFDSVVSSDGVILMEQRKVFYCIYAIIEYEDVGEPRVTHHTQTCNYSKMISETNYLFPACSIPYEEAN